MKYVYIVERGNADCGDGGTAHYIVGIYENLTNAISIAKSLKPQLQNELHEADRKDCEFFKHSTAQDIDYEWISVVKWEVQ